MSDRRADQGSSSDHRRYEDPRRDDGDRERRHRGRSRSDSPSRYERRDRDRSRSRDRQSERRRDEERHRDRPRSRSRDRRDRQDDRDRRRGRRHGSSSSSESESESDSEDDRRRRRKEKRRREEKEDRKRRKEKKRLKKEKKRSTAAVTAQWGKYGIISEADVANKDSEFRAWLIEERKLNPETISKDRTRKEFSTFVEDYNTATLPHEKFYDMQKYDIRMNLIRSGQSAAMDVNAYDPLADMKAHNSTIKSQFAKKETSLSRAEIEELRRVEAERVEVAKRRQLGLDVPRHLGVRTEQVKLDEFTFE